MNVALLIILAFLTLAIYLGIRADTSSKKSRRLLPVRERETRA